MSDEFHKRLAEQALANIDAEIAEQRKWFQEKRQL